MSCLIATALDFLGLETLILKVDEALKIPSLKDPKSHGSTPDST